MVIKSIIIVFPAYLSLSWSFIPLVLSPFLCTPPYVLLSSTLVHLRVKDFFFFFSSFYTLSCLYNMLGLNEKPFCKSPVIYPIALKFYSDSCLLLVIRSHYVVLTNTPNETLSHLHPSFLLEFINFVQMAAFFTR